jgi:hypothetical protein
MAATQPLATSNINQSNAATASTAFGNLCNGHPVLNSTLRCTSVQQAIAGAVNVVKRPALLCSSLQLCSTNLSSSCLVDVVSSGSAAVQVAAPSLDNCHRHVHFSSSKMTNVLPRGASLSSKVQDSNQTGQQMGPCEVHRYEAG